jgi:hypothetical protein
MKRPTTDRRVTTSIFAGLALVALIVHLLTIHRYGYFRDVAESAGLVVKGANVFGGARLCRAAEAIFGLKFNLRLRRASPYQKTMASATW